MTYKYTLVENKRSSRSQGNQKEETMKMMIYSEKIMSPLMSYIEKLKSQFNSYLII